MSLIVQKLLSITSFSFWIVPLKNRTPMYILLLLLEIVLAIFNRFYILFLLLLLDSYLVFSLFPCLSLSSVAIFVFVVA